MTSRKRGIRTLGLSVILGLVGAITLLPDGTQAHTHTEELHRQALGNNELPLSSLLGTYLINLAAALLATFTGTQIGASQFSIPGRNLEIECQTLHLTEGKIESSSDARAKATYLECVALRLDDGKPLPCEFVGLGTFAALFLILPITHGGENFLLFEPASGSAFTVVAFKEGTECPLPLNNPASGSISASVDALDAVVQLILFSKSIQLLTGDVLRFGGFPSYIERHAGIELIGEHLGEKLGIH